MRKRVAAEPNKRISPEQAFGIVLRKAREARNISQEELAFASGYHRTYIGQLERGEKSPSLRTLFAVCVPLGAMPSSLVAAIEKIVRERH